MAKAPTPGPWFSGAQNDILYIVAGRAPAMNNDHPVHDAKRVAIAKLYRATEGDALPVDADANGRLMAAAPDMLAALKAARPYIEEGFQGFGDPDREGAVLRKIDEAIAKAEGCNQ